MIFYFPYLFLLLFVIGFLVLFCCHKPISRKVIVILLCILLVILILCIFIIFLWIFPFSSPSDVISYYKLNSDKMIVSGENTAIAILDLPNSDLSLKGFYSDKNNWHPINYMQDINYRYLSSSTSTGTICIIKLPEDNGTYLLNIWTDLIPGQVKTLSDNINSTFNKCTMDIYSISLIYIPEIVKDYVLYVNGDPVDLSSLRTQEYQNGANISNDYWIFLSFGLIFFAVTGSVISYSVWLKKKSQPRGLHK